MDAKKVQYAVCGIGSLLVVSLGLAGVVLIPDKLAEISGFCGLMMVSLLKHAYNVAKLDDVKQIVTKVSEVTTKTEKMVNSATGINLAIASKAAEDLVTAKPSEENIRAMDIAQAKVVDHNITREEVNP